MSEQSAVMAGCADARIVAYENAAPSANPERRLCAS